MWGKSANVAFETFGRAAFGVGVAWVIYACVNGSGGLLHVLIFNPYSAEVFLYKPWRPKGFSI